MRFISIALGVVVLSASVPARADDAADAKAIVDKAIKAVGGADKLAKYPAMKRKGKGTLQIFDKDMDPAAFTFESTLQGIDQVRLEFQLGHENLKGGYLMVYDRNKGWLKSGIQDTVDLPEVGSEPFFKEDYRMMRLAELLTPLLSKEYKLAPLGETVFEKRARVGVKISEKGHPDYDLYFDKETRLPVEGLFRMREMKDGAEIVHELFFTAYKDVDGLQCISKLSTKREYKKCLDIEWSEIKPLEKVEKGTFDKP